MDFITDAELTPMSKEEWESYENEIVQYMNDQRGTSFEYTQIKNLVKAKDGDTSAGTQIYRHYISYDMLRQAMYNYAVTGTRLHAVGWLEEVVDAIYTTSMLPKTDLKPPRPPFAGSLQRVIDGRARAEMSAWTTWALQIICDYPDNLFYGPGSGDNGGKAIDVPTGGPQSAVQKARVENSAKVLRKAFGGKLDQWVDANGKPVK